MSQETHIVRADLPESSDTLRIISVSGFDIKQVEGSHWDKDIGAWHVPIVPQHAESLREFILPSHRLRGRMDRIIAQKTVLRENRLAMSYRTEPLVIPNLPPLGKDLRNYQLAGVEYVSSMRSALIADDMGLGKTIQAIADMEMAGVFPVLVISPAVAVWNWVAEIRAATGKQAGVAGAATKKAPITGADWVICSASSLHKVEMVHFRGLVIDEIHAFKGSNSLRTKQMQWLLASGNVDKILALSGTPFSNGSAAELVSQLDILGVLHEFGGRSAFLDRYSDTRSTPRGPELYGGINLDELGIRMREICMIRRLRADVLPDLPPVQVSRVEVHLTNRAEYKIAEEFFEQWYLEKLAADPSLVAFPDEDTSTWTPAYTRHRALIKIENMTKGVESVAFGQLRKLTGLGKVKAALDWIREFREDSPGTPLIVFMQSVLVQQAVVSVMGADPDVCLIMGDTPSVQRQAAVEAFQRGDKRLILLSLQAANTAITLTAACHMLFVEIDHMPGTMDQAIARAHRMGQKNSVNVYMLIAKSSLDQTLVAMELIKRERFNRVFNGENNG